ncbi:MAG: RusA family crossover junction endodeoxyribonuclease, partial [Litorimonas sp.]
VFKLPQRLHSRDPRRMGSPHAIKPDGDNLAKLVKDALNGLAYHDDAQVSTTIVEKQWSDHDRTVVTLEWLPVDRIARAA